MSTRWKQVERGIARLLGGVRVPLLGRQGSDLDVPYLFVEVKSRKMIAPYLWNDFLAQILEGADVAGERVRIPAIVLHRPGMKYKDALLCVRVGDWERLVRLIQEGTNATTE
jgi:hypothetical protein